jgi:HK97 family phage prohead protease
MTEFVRSFALEDIRIRSGGDGRTVEAYAAVFNSPAEIHDRDGHYLEQLDARAFNKAIKDAAPSGSRAGWLTKVMFNHGRDMYGNSAAEYSMPIGTPVDIQADSRGLLTVTRYARTRVADDVLELIREGAITAQSFQGRFIRSDREVPVGGFAPSDRGDLTLVTRQEVSLVEYGPTPFPAYQEAAVVGVRADIRTAVDQALADRLTDFLATQRAGEAPDTPTGAVEDEPQTHSPSYLNLRAAAREKGIL